MRTGRLSISRGHQLQGTPDAGPPQLTLVPPAARPHRVRAGQAAGIPDYHAVHDRLTSLERLTRLFELGALSAEEFAAEKALILGLPADELVLREPAPVHFVPAAPRRAAARAVAARADAGLEVPPAQPRRRPRLLLRHPARTRPALLRPDSAPVRRLGAAAPAGRILDDPDRAHRRREPVENMELAGRVGAEAGRSRGSPRARAKLPAMPGHRAEHAQLRAGVAILGVEGVADEAAIAGLVRLPAAEGADLRLELADRGGDERDARRGAWSETTRRVAKLSEPSRTRSAPSSRAATLAGVEPLAAGPRSGRRD